MLLNVKEINTKLCSGGGLDAGDLHVDVGPELDEPTGAFPPVFPQGGRAGSDGRICGAVESRVVFAGVLVRIPDLELQLSKILANQRLVGG